MSGDPGSSCLRSSAITRALSCPCGSRGHHTMMSFQAAVWVGNRKRAASEKGMTWKLCTSLPLNSPARSQANGRIWSFLTGWGRAICLAPDQGFYFREQGERMLEDSCHGLWEKFSQQSGQCRALSQCPAPWNSKGSVRWGLGTGAERLSIRG